MNKPILIKVFAIGFALNAALCSVSWGAFITKVGVPYGTAVGVVDGVCRQTMDIYYDDAKSAQPVFVYFHGGGFKKGGSKEMPASGATWHNSFGFATISVNYRLKANGANKPNDQATAAQQQEDIWKALAFIRSNANLYHINPDKMVVGGSSAGGHLSGCLAYCSDNGFNWLPGTSLPALAAGIKGYIGFSPAIDVLNGDKPAGHVSVGEPRALLMDGTDDGFNPAINNFSIELDSNHKGLLYKFNSIDGAPHMGDLATVYAKNWTQLSQDMKDVYETEAVFLAEKTLLTNDIKNFMKSCVGLP